MRERDIEEEVCQYARKKYDAIAYKFTSPSRRSVPDRLFVFPLSALVFIEFKATDGVPTEAQEREIKRLRDRGHAVFVIDDINEGKAVVDMIADGP